MDSEYFITYDENGEVHLEHAWLRRGQAHKYILKIGEGLKARYFYTQAEVDAYMNRGKQKAQNVADKTKKSINDLTGATAKKQLEKAKYNDRLAKLATKKAESAVDRARQNHDPNTGRLNLEAIKAEVHDMDTEKQVRYSQKKYDKTPMGIAEKTASNVKSAAQRLNEKTKSKMDKMREEFRKSTDSVKDAASKTVSEVKAKSFDKKAEKLQNKANDLKKESFNNTSKQKDAAQAQIDANNARIKALEEDSKASNHKTNKLAIDKLKAQNDNLKDVADGNEIREQFVEEKSITENEIKEEKIRDSASKSKFDMYTKGDPDFDEKNYDEKDRIGDTEFFSFKNADGRTVIVEEDMKWTLPEGVDPKDPAIKEAISKFGDQVASARAKGDYTTFSGDKWEKAATAAIDEAVEKAQEKKTSKQETKSDKWNELTNTHAKYSEYTKGDPDFDDDKFDDKNRVGDTDFFSFKNDDGRTVIIEEDMKWVLPAGVDAHDPGIMKALKTFDEEESSARAINGGTGRYTHDEWVKAVTDAIDDASVEARSKYPDPNKMRKSNTK